MSKARRSALNQTLAIQYLQTATPDFLIQEFFDQDNFEILENCGLKLTFTSDKEKRSIKLAIEQSRSKQSFAASLVWLLKRKIRTG